jgi:hypothetical protein
MPHVSTVYRWIAANDTFRDMYARAREDQADTLADQIIDISDDSTNDFVDAGVGENADGSPIATSFNSEHVQRAKLRVDARKWVAAKLKPKKYGDKLSTEHTGADGGPIEMIKKIERVLIKPDLPKK